MQKNGEFWFTNNKVLLSHFEPPKFNIVLAIHVHDNAVAFRPRDFAANEFQPFNCPPIGLTALGGLTLGSAPYF